MIGRRGERGSGISMLAALHDDDDDDDDCYLTIIIPSKRLYSSIWPMNGTLTGTTTPSQSGPGLMTREGYSTFSKSPELEPHH